MPKPKPGFVKCKIDAALSVNQNYYGIGVGMIKEISSKHSQYTNRQNITKERQGSRHVNDFKL